MVTLQYYYVVMYFYRFRSMLPMYYRRANAAIIVYDVTSKDSFIQVTEWVQGMSWNVL